MFLIETSIHLQIGSPRNRHEHQQDLDGSCYRLRSAVEKFTYLDQNHSLERLLEQALQASGLYVNAYS